MIWNSSYRATRIREVVPSEQPSVRNGRPGPVAKHSTLYDLSQINPRWCWTGLETGVSKRPSQESARLSDNTIDQSNNGLAKPRMVLRPLKVKGFVEHVHCTMTTSKPHLIRLQLARTKGTWQRRAAAATSALQVSRDVTTFLKKLIWILSRLVHQLCGDTRPVSNYPYWKSGKSTSSLDKRMLLSGINTNSLAPTRPRPSLDPRNHTFNYLFRIYSIILCNLLHLFSPFTVSLLTLSSESI